MKRAEPKKIRGVFEKVPGSGIWWIQYFDSRRKRRREKAGSRGCAIALYRKRKIQALEGRKLPENIRSVVSISDLAPAILRDYEINARRSSDTLERRLRKHLLPFFGAMAAEDLTTEDFNRYIDRRKERGAENATINREMAALKRILHLARNSHPPKIRHMPAFPARLKENPAREGFVEEDQFTTLMEYAEEIWFKAFLATAYSFGFRKSEMLLQMKVRQVDLKNKLITLYPGTTKSGQGRLVTMTDEVCELLKSCVAGKQAADHVFTRENGPVRDFRTAWWRACERAGLGKFVKVKDRDGRIREKWHGLVPHDLRRSAARNMRRYGIDESVIMKIGGWKTRSVFDRYNIVSETDIVEAAHKIQARRKQSAAEQVDPSATTTATSRSDDAYEYAAMADKSMRIQSVA
jgi:site-specific recombinase XerD